MVKERMYTTKQLAESLGTSELSIKCMCDDGSFPFARKDPVKGYLFSESEVINLLGKADDNTDIIGMREADSIIALQQWLATRRIIEIMKSDNGKSLLMANLLTGEFTDDVKNADKWNMAFDQIVGEEMKQDSIRISQRNLSIPPPRAAAKKGV